MRIVHVNTYDIRGGAARAAYRLHQGLLQLGEDSRMLVRHKDSTDDSVYSMTPTGTAERLDEELLLSTVIQGHYINSHRTDISNTLFSLPYPGYDLSPLPLVQAADVINLHWVAYYQSPVTLHRLLDLGKPMVWTLHDQWALTGGCHYTAGCKRYRRQCRDCPQLAEDPFGLPETVLKDKLELLGGADLTIVTPCRWMATCTTESRLFRDMEVRVIPYSLETDAFRPLPKTQARETVGLSVEGVVLLFGAPDVKEKRKGFRELVAAMQYCLAQREFETLVKSDKIRLLCFGQASDELEAGGTPVVSLGYLGSDEEMRVAYAAADIFVLPSLEDNMPNAMLEAMSCGTPVVGFAVGGMPDVVVDGVTGRLVPPGDVPSLGDAILDLVLDSDKRELMGQNCRKAMVDGYSLDLQARRYLELYNDLCRQPRMGAQSEPEQLAGAELEMDGSALRRAEDSLPARLETGLGPSFQGIYEGVLSKALREFCPAREKAYQMSEADRAARLETIQEQGRRLGELEGERNDLRAQVDELHPRLGAAEADRASRLEAIHEQGRRLGELEAERNDLQSQLTDLRDQFESVEADRAARLEVIRAQGERLGELEQTLRGISQSRTYRLLRRLGGWAQMERTLAQLALATGSSGPQAGDPVAGDGAPPPAADQSRHHTSDLMVQETSATNQLGNNELSEAPDNTVNIDPKISEGTITVFPSLEDYVLTIEAFNKTRPDMDDVRAYNHAMIDVLAELRPIVGKRLLDVGASPHGYALERALRERVSAYLGVGLGVHETVEVRHRGNVGRLVYMNAEELTFQPETFDLILCLSGFEHFSDGAKVLREMHRVLKPGGSVLIHFQPVWTCSYGHHLHHVESLAKLIPPWAHLVWSEETMRGALEGQWPTDAAMSLEDAIGWIFRSPEINRVDIVTLRSMFCTCEFEMEWMTPLPDDESDYRPVIADYLAKILPYSADDLMTVGFSILMNKEGVR